MDVGLPVGQPFLRRIDFVQPEIGDNFPRDIADQSGVGIADIGVGLDPPVSPGNIPADSF